MLMRFCIILFYVNLLHLMNFTVILSPLVKLSQGLCELHAHGLCFSPAFSCPSPNPQGSAMTLSTLFSHLTQFHPYH